MSPLWTVATTNLSSNYEIVCTDDLFNDPACLAPFVNTIQAADRVIVVTDSNVASLSRYSEIKAVLVGVNPEISEFVFPPGEASKTQATADALIAAMIAIGCTRKSLLVALGGGVVGDLVGYVAGIFMRGIPFLQFPTSLLAMVDSSVGGKCAVDAWSAKNVVGVFKQPAGVLIDLNFLARISDRQFSNGIAEAIKVAVVSKDEELWSKLEKLVDRNFQQISDIVRVCVQYKLRLVELDEFDCRNFRSALNFGHTVGHGLEMAAGNFLHGEAVAVGMVVEAMALGDYRLAKRIGNLNRKFQLPDQFPAVDIDKFFDCMRKDKKRTSNKFPITGVPDETSVHQFEEATLRRLVSPAVRVSCGNSGEFPITVDLPGSKSLSNRALVLAALSVLGNFDGKTALVTNFTFTEDTTVMLEGLRLLGWQSEISSDQVAISGFILPGEDEMTLFVENAGTAARFLLPLASLVLGISENLQSIVVDGNSRMRQRPIGPLVASLTELFGNFLAFTCETGCLPVRVTRKSNSEKFPANLPSQVVVDGTISSQFVSALLLVGPFLARETGRDFRVQVAGTATSQPYIDMTLGLLEIFGSTCVTTESRGVVFSGNFRSPVGGFAVSGDASSASYVWALAAVAGQEVTTNVGSACGQGDFAFLEFLERLGCEVQRTRETSTVRPLVKRRIGNLSIDFADLTDTFLTAAAVLAVVLDEDEAVTIGNIANQRVKECDRIAKICEALKLLGFPVVEHSDGLTISGSTHFRSPHFHRAALDVAGDHRMAMSLAVLAAGLGPEAALVIPDPLCVQKTFPDFWETAVRDFRLQVDGVNAFDPFPHVQVLIGMRGVGKSTLARSVAGNFRVVDLDDQISASLHPASISAFVETHGWERFRALEYETLLTALSRADARFPTLIVCGGGIVESARSRDVLKRLETIWLRRSDAQTLEMAAQAAAGGHRASLAQNIEEVYAKRLPLYAECSRSDIFLPASLTGTENVRVFAAGFHRFTSIPEFFCCLTVAGISRAKAEAIAVDVDAVELRVDLLPATADEASEVARLRMLFPDQQVILTLRSSAEGGGFTGDQAEYERRIRTLLRLRPDWVDVELARIRDERGPFQAELAEAARRSGGPVRFICSSHEAPVESRRFFEVLRPSWAYVGKVVGVFNAENLQSRAAAERECGKLCIAVGDKISRVLTPAMTPVTHKSLPPAAPNQTSALWLQRQRREMLGAEQYDRKFFLFGYPISRSPSPAMHNALFEAAGRTHWQYGKFETSDVAEAVAAMEKAEFGGASVTIPLKEKIFAWAEGRFDAARISDLARRARAVNTVVKRHGNFFFHNTDVLAIIEAIHARISDPAGRMCLVLGSGGAARAALVAAEELEMEIFVLARDETKLEQLKHEFAISEFPDEQTLVDVAVSCVPGDAELEIPRNFRFSEETVAVEMAYLPRVTKFLETLSPFACRVVGGAEILALQGLAQSRLWTGDAEICDRMRGQVLSILARDA